MEIRKCNDLPEGVKKAEDKVESIKLSKSLEDMIFRDDNESFFHDFPKSHVKCKKEHAHASHKLQKLETKTGKPETTSISRGMTGKQRIPDFPWKWDLPDIQSSPVEGHTRRRRVAKTNQKTAISMDQETDRKLKEFDNQVSWIFEETSESETELLSSSKIQEDDGEGANKNTFDDKFRNHIMKELLKLGKGMKWFVDGAQKALDKLGKSELANEPGIISAVKVSQELNQFLINSMRPYYKEKKKERRTKKKSSQAAKR